MMVGGKDRAARLWKSTDLLNWKQFLDIPNKSAECLDMYCLPVDGDKNNMKWVISSAQTFYEVGDFDGDKWTGFGNKDKRFSGLITEPITMQLRPSPMVQTGVLFRLAG